MSHLPHEGVYTRLGSSKIHGVGVFAIRDIPKGASVFVDDDADIVWVDKKDIEGLSSAIRRFYDDFAIIKGNSYGCPISFDKLTNSWFLNDSKEPNVAPDEEYRFYAIRDIKEGEELTADYDAYSDRPTSRDRN